MAPRQAAPTARMVATSPDLFIQEDDDMTVANSPAPRATFSSNRAPLASGLRAQSMATSTVPGNQVDMITFVVGENVTDKQVLPQDLPSRRRNSPQVHSGVQRQEFRRHLRFFNHKVGGKINETSPGEPVHLPDLRPQTFDSFMDALFDPVGQASAFRQILPLCNAFCVAIALEDDEFQRLVIEKIHGRVVTLAESIDLQTEKSLYNRLIERVVWAWSVDSAGRLALRRILTVSLIFVSSGWNDDVTKLKKRKRAIKEEDDEETQIKIEPILNMKLLEELTQRLGKLDNFGEVFMPAFMKCCNDLSQYNRFLGKEGWAMLPVAKLLPQELIPVVEL